MGMLTHNSLVEQEKKGVGKTPAPIPKKVVDNQTEKPETKKVSKSRK